MKIVAATLGSAGDVDPVVGMGRVLRERGHEVTVLTHAPFEKLVRGSGLAFRAVDTEEEYRAHLQRPGMNPLELLRDNLLRSVEPVYRMLMEEYVPGRTAVVAQSSALGARLAQERWGVPVATVHLAPLAFKHARPEVVGPLDAAVLPGLNAFRESVGLGPLQALFADGWMHSPRMVLGLFPDWFAPDLEVPPNTRLTGFPLYDESGVEELPADLEAFLTGAPAPEARAQSIPPEARPQSIPPEARPQQSPPIVFTFGTAMEDCRPLLQASADACRDLGRRGILLTRYRDQVPSPLPDGVRHFDFIPLSQVLPRAAAMVHHGGIGTTSQTMAAGIPHVVVPFAFDQPENARLVERLGLGHWIKPAEYSAARAAEALRPLLDSAEVKARCAEVRSWLAGVRGLEAAADAVESLGQPAATA